MAIGYVGQGGVRQVLWGERRSYAVAIGVSGCEGLRVSPHVYSTLEEVDRFCDAVEEFVAEH